MAKGETRDPFELGDLVLIGVEGTDVARTYNTVLELTFKSGRQVLFDMEIEPVVRETVEDYRRNPTDHDRRIRASAIEGEGWQFLASDVLSYQEVQTSSPAFSLLYPLHVRMFHLWDGTKPVLFYHVHEEDILTRLNV